MRTVWIVGTNRLDTSAFARSRIDMLLKKQHQISIKKNPGCAFESIREFTDKTESVRYVSMPSDSEEKARVAFNLDGILFSPDEEERAANFYKDAWRNLKNGRTTVET